MEQLSRKGDAPVDEALRRRARGEAALEGARVAASAPRRAVPGKADTWEGWEDSAVPPEQLGGYLRELRKLFDTLRLRRRALRPLRPGLRAHAASTSTCAPPTASRSYRRFIEEAARPGGRATAARSPASTATASRKAEFLPMMFGERAGARAFASSRPSGIPTGSMNPGKVVDPYRIDENLRLGTDLPAAGATTHFQVSARTAAASPSATAALRGHRRMPQDRRRHDVPELHGDQRGEALDARPRAPAVRDAARAIRSKAAGATPAVKEALDLCLACKGCKGECPVNVDMATYKAEFLSHYYEGGCGRARRTPWGSSTGGRGSPRACPALVNCADARAAPLGALQAGSAAWRRSAAFRASRRRRSAPGSERRPRAERGGTSGCCSGPTPSTTSSIPRRRRPPSRCWRMRASR